MLLFLPFRRLLRATRTRHCDVCPAAVPDRCCRSSRNILRTPTLTSRRPHLVDETFGGEECAAENCEPRENTWRDRARNIFSPRRRRTRVVKFHSPPRSCGKRLNLRAFGRSDSCRMTRGRCSKKIWPRRRRTQDFRVALVTMTLTHCRTCAFRARFFYVAFHLGPWLKGFCAVA
jgi:hypothetical protein